MRQRLPKGLKRELTKEIEAAIVDIVEWRGFSVTITEPRFNRGVMSFAVKLIQGSPAEHYANQYLEHCESAGMRREWLGKYLRFAHEREGVTYLLAGWDHRKKKMKVILIDPDGNEAPHTPESVVGFATFVENPQETAGNDT